MLYLYIYKVKYEMNTYKFQHDIGDTAVCMEIVMKDTKGCGKLYFKKPYFMIAGSVELKQRRRKVQRC